MRNRRGLSTMVGAVFFIIAFPKLVPVFTDTSVILTWTELQPGFWFLIEQKEVL